ncbi:GRF1-interacting factor like [Actinidia chinensis var. chinensis]|uniref:GRF1-interacting factor like n=2 Tax=Actinidia chinensis var. chinensis TaxID=1590841 RepID=A0A2R6PW54_ACTCC|nr:GRF1-interacting factor like [Actinidia chinensis var. chinensis]
MQQHLMQMQPMMAAYYPNNVTTDHIQQYLDENKSLILKIVESQNSGKLSECAENQARLQRNLMYLAAIADSQPQPPTMQFSPSGMIQPGAHYLQHQQAQQMTPQSLMAARSSALYSQQQFLALQQQQAMHSQLGMSSGGSSGLHMMQSEANSTGGSSGAVSFPVFALGSAGEGLQTATGRGMVGGSKQEMGSAEGRGGGSGGHHGGDGSENLYLKAGDDGN